MTNTKADLEKRIAELEAQAAQPPDLRIISIAFDMEGRAVSVASNARNASPELRAQKVALANAAQFVDSLLIAAVEKEATEKARRDAQKS